MKFLDNLKNTLKDATFINHVNFCGMNLPYSELMKIIEECLKCPFLIAIHISDNNINDDD